MRAGLLLLVFIVAGCGKPAPGTRVHDAEAPPERNALSDGPHKELAGQLGQKGIKVVVEPILQYSTSEKTAAAFYTNEPMADSPRVFVYACREPRAAAEQARAMGHGAFAYERFAIGLPPPPESGLDNKGLLLRIKNALAPSE